MGDNIDYDKLADAFARAQAQQAKFGAKPGLSGSFDPKQIDALLKRVKDTTENLDKLNKKSMSFTKSLSPMPQNLEYVREELEALEEAYKKAENNEQKREIEKQRDALKNTAIAADNIEITKKLGGSMKQVASVGLQGVGAFIKGLQGGESGIKLASGMMEASLDMAGQTSAAAGQAIGSVGQVAATSTNPKIRALGTAASIAGPLLGALGEGASKLAKFGVQVLAAEVEKTVKAFNTASASGAMFADGMTGLRNAANQAGLTVDQFAGVLQKHSTELAALGMGVTEGAKRVGGALDAGGKEMKQSLLNMGYGFEEQAGLVAETMKDMKGSGGPLKASNAQVAAETQKYAENLRVISGITGEDAKKKMEQVREQGNQLAFQQKLAGMGETQRKGAMAAMANMSDIERKNFMDMVNFGTVINQEGAAAAATSEGLANSVNASYKSFQDGKLDEIEQRKIAGEYGAQIKKDMLDNTAIGLAGAAGVGGLVQGLSESMGKELQFRNSFTPEAIKAAEESAAAQKNTNDTLTKSVTGAETAAQNLKLALEKELTPAIGKFAEVAKEMLGSVQKMMKDAGLGRGAGGDNAKEGGEKGIWDSIKDKVSGVNDYLKESKVLSTGLGVGGTAAEIGGAAASMTGVGAIGGVPLAAIGAVMQGVGLIAGMAGYAGGGVSAGPADGYLQKLHGTEAIVPLPDGKSIPVDMSGFMAELKQLLGENSKSSATSGMPVMGGLMDTFDKMNEIMAQQVKHQEEMVGHMRDQKDISQQILYSSS